MSEEHIEDLPLDGESAEGVVGGSSPTPKAPAIIPDGTAIEGAPPAPSTPTGGYAPKAPAADMPTGAVEG